MDDFSLSALTVYRLIPCPKTKTTSLKGFAPAVFSRYTNVRVSVGGRELVHDLGGVSHPTNSIYDRRRRPRALTTFPGLENERLPAAALRVRFVRFYERRMTTIASSTRSSSMIQVGGNQNRVCLPAPKDNNRCNAHRRAFPMSLSSPRLTLLVGFELSVSQFLRNLYDERIWSGRLCNQSKTCLAQLAGLGFFSPPNGPTVENRSRATE